jgi:hypothetical protein
MAQSDIPLSNKARGPFVVPTTGDLVLGSALLGHNLDAIFTRHVIQIFGWDTNVDTSNNDLLVEVQIIGPAGEIPQSDDDGFVSLGSLVSTAGQTTSPNSSGSHTIILDCKADGPIIETIAGGIGLTTIRFPAKAMRLRFTVQGGATTFANLGEAKRLACKAYVKSITTFTT